jgi:hypothetical protein
MSKTNSNPKSKENNIIDEDINRNSKTMVLNFPNCGKEIHPRFCQSANELFGYKKILRLSSLTRPCDWILNS